MVTYQLLKDFDGIARGAVIRTSDDGIISIIPCNSDNRDYAEYLIWVTDGNTPLAAE